MNTQRERSGSDSGTGGRLRAVAYAVCASIALLAGSPTCLGEGIGPPSPTRKVRSRSAPQGLVPTPLSGITTGGEGATGKAPDKLSDKAAVKSAEKSSERQRFHVVLRGGGAVGGPLVYDRLAVASGTGAIVRDPAFVSGIAGLELIQDFAAGSSFLQIYGRRFQPVANEVEGRYDDNGDGTASRDPDLRQVTEVQAQAYGLLMGWQFRSTASGARLLPRAGIGYEQGALTVRGSEVSALDGQSRRDDIAVAGKIQLLTGMVGLRWLWLVAPAYTGFDLDLLGPIAGRKEVETMTNGASLAAEANLHFGARLGGTLGFFIGL